MEKKTLDVIVDTVIFVVAMCMVSTGLLLKFVLPPGSGRIEMLTQGGGRRHKVIDVFWGLTRHEWGEIHFFIAMAFVVLLVAHLVLHWSWIKATAFGVKGCPRSLTRKIIALGMLLFAIFVLLLPWIGNKKTYSGPEFLETREMTPSNK